MKNFIRVTATHYSSAVDSQLVSIAEPTPLLINLDLVAFCLRDDDGGTRVTFSTGEEVKLDLPFNDFDAELATR